MVKNKLEFIRFYPGFNSPPTQCIAEFDNSIDLAFNKKETYIFCAKNENAPA